SAGSWAAFATPITNAAPSSGPGSVGKACVLAGCRESATMMRFFISNMRRRRTRTSRTGDDCTTPSEPRVHDPYLALRPHCRDRRDVHRFLGTGGGATEGGGAGSREGKADCDAGVRGMPR